MDTVIPGMLLLRPIKKHYPKAGKGRQPYPLETMLRIYFLRQWYQLSEATMEESLYYIESKRRLAHSDQEQAIADVTTI